MTKYSQELNTRLKAYFKVRYDLIISDDEADLYLDSLAELVSLFDDIAGDRASGPGER